MMQEMPPAHCTQKGVNLNPFFVPILAQHLQHYGLTCSPAGLLLLGGLPLAGLLLLLLGGLLQLLGVLLQLLGVLLQLLGGCCCLVVCCCCCCCFSFFGGHVQ